METGYSGRAEIFICETTAATTRINARIAEINAAAKAESIARLAAYAARLKAEADAAAAVKAALTPKPVVAMPKPGPILIVITPAPKPTVTPVPKPAPTVTPAPKPTPVVYFRVTAGVATTSAVPLTWTAPAVSGITDYTVQFRVSGAVAWSTFAHPVSTATGVTVTGLNKATAYQFQVVAKATTSASSFTAVRATK